MTATNTPYLEEQHLHIGNEGGYVMYNCGALIASSRGTILHICEARKNSTLDTGQIDLVLRRSFDQGQTFDKSRVIAHEEGWVCGNMAPVVDQSTGVIWLLFTKNRMDGDEQAIIEGTAPCSRSVWITHSEDDGASWSPPQEITDSVKLPNWTWYATGPGHGIQLKSGRLVIACNHVVMENGRAHIPDQENVLSDPYHSHVIYSDDHGSSWQIGGSTDEGQNECTVLEADDGQLYLNCRNKNMLADGGNYRGIAWSRDQGESFSPIVHDAALPEPICEASVLRFTNRHDHDRNRVLFSNPAGLADGKTKTPKAIGQQDRRELTIRMSYDECRTWPVSKVLYSGRAGYSDLCITDDMTILCCYLNGVARTMERVTLARFNLEWLTDGADHVSNG